MNCTLALRMLDAYVDDEVDAATRASIAQHLDSCAGCRDARDRRVAMSAALRAPELRHDAPARLRNAIARQIKQTRRPARSPRWSRWWQALAFGSVMAAVGATGGWWLAQPQRLDMIPDIAVERHVASLTPTGPRLDVVSSDRHTVRPWFQGRSEFAPMVRDLAAQGFELLGARVDHLGNRQAIALAYRLRAHVIDVFSWRATPGAAPPDKGSTIRGFNVMTWRDGDLDYAVVSDADWVELTRFVTAYRGN